MKGFFAIILLITFVCSSCEYHCSPATPNIAFVSFPDSETDTVIVERFVIRSNFTKVVDTNLIDRFNSSFQKSNDTLYISTSFGLEVGFMSKYDYEITLPASGRHFRLSEIAEAQSTISKDLFSNTKVSCVNAINSYRLNNQLITGAFIETFYINR